MKNSKARKIMDVAKTGAYQEQRPALLIFVQCQYLSNEASLIIPTY